MKFGVREICDVVFRAKANQKIGKKQFYKDEPVIYFDSLKTSTLEGAATTVYAQGGRGNARLVAWEGERTVTFTMEDALISPLGLMILTGAGLVEGSEAAPIQVHTTDTIGKDAGFTYSDSGVTIELAEPVSIKTPVVYVMPLKNGEIIAEPSYGEAVGGATIVGLSKANATNFAEADAVLVDYYTDHKTSSTQQIEIKADSFGGNFYVEASTLFRTQDGVDMPAEFIIPNAKIQSNFTFTMASSGDPSTFTFTLDAFPDYTRFNKAEKVFFAIQIVEDPDGSDDDAVRTSTVDAAN